MKLLVCGGRDFADEWLLRRVLDSIYAKHQPLILIEGGATGADNLAAKWANGVGVHRATVHALWEHHGKGAGPLRNAAMLLLEPDLVVAFPGGIGTENMVKQARNLGITVRAVRAGEMATEVLDG